MGCRWFVEAFVRRPLTIFKNALRRWDALIVSRRLISGFPESEISLGTGCDDRTSPARCLLIQRRWMTRRRIACALGRPVIALQGGSEYQHTVSAFFGRPGGRFDLSPCRCAPRIHELFLRWSLLGCCGGGRWWAGRHGGPMCGKFAGIGRTARADVSGSWR